MLLPRYLERCRGNKHLPSVAVCLEMWQPLPSYVNFGAGAAGFSSSSDHERQQSPPPPFPPVRLPQGREYWQLTEQVREWMQKREEDAVPRALRWPLWLKLSHKPWRRKLNVSTPYRVGLIEAGGDPGKTEQGAVCAVSVAQGSRSVRGCQGLREGLATTRGAVHGSPHPPSVPRSSRSKGSVL